MERAVKDLRVRAEKAPVEAVMGTATTLMEVARPNPVKDLRASQASPPVTAEMGTATATALMKAAVLVPNPVKDHPPNPPRGHPPNRPSHVPQGQLTMVMGMDTGEISVPSKQL